MQRPWIAIAALNGLIAVAMAAYAAHAIPDPAAARAAASGVQMQSLHALALLATALWAPSGGRLAQAAAACFALGTLLFTAGVYAQALAATSLGPVAPTGGTILMAGWLLLALSAIRR